MAPPELSGNAPVAYIVRPVKINLFHTFGNQPDLTLFHRFHGRPDQFIHLNEPLFFYHGFNGRAASVMGSHIMGMSFNTD